VLCVGAVMLLFDIIFSLTIVSLSSANERKNNKQKCDIEININAIETQFELRQVKLFCAFIDP
jgi:hypothetical protein